MFHRTFLAASIVAASISAFAHAGGSTTITPADSIQATINSGLYTEIILSPGVYNQTFDFDGAAITVRSMDPSDPSVVESTVIDGANLDESIILCSSGETSETKILGLTLRNGNAAQGGLFNSGGAINCLSGSPTIADCIFEGNTASAVGGALYTSGSNMTIERCTFVGNGDTAPGGAIYAFQSDLALFDCGFEGNSGFNGGAIFYAGGELFIEECTFIGNETNGPLVTYAGGAVHTDFNTSGTFSRCWFEENSSGSRGGAVMHNASTSNRLGFDNCVFTDNVADEAGSAIYTVSPIDVRHCTVVGGTGRNAIDTCCGSTTTTIANTVVVDNQESDGTPTGIFGNAAIVDVDYCMLDVTTPGTGNVIDDPMFMDAANRDFRLMADSPAIDAGDSREVAGEYPVDFDGNNRAINTEVADSGVSLLGLATDIGAYEFGDAGTEPMCAGDLNGDDEVGFSDLVNLLSAWGQCP